MNNYSPGDVVNGHRLNETGTEWTPIDTAPNETMPPKKPGWSKGKKIAVGVGGAFAFLLLLGAISGGGESAPAQGNQAAADQAQKEADEKAAADQAQKEADEKAAAEQAQKEADEKAAAEQAQKEAEAQEPGIGTPVKDGKFEFVVTDVKTGVTTVGDKFLNETAQGAFTLVTIKVTNIGDKPQTFFDSNLVGFDSQGREVAVDSGAGIYANTTGDSMVSEINPGNSVTVTVVFDLAVGETLTQVEVHDSAFSKGALIRLV